MLQKLLAVFVLYKCIYWCVDFQLLFTNHSIVYNNTIRLSWWRMPVFFLFSHSSVVLNAGFILLAALCAIYILMKEKYNRPAFFILWFVISNINNAAFCTLSGGDYVFQHFLFFAIFLSGTYTQSDAPMNELSRVFHNTGVMALRIQLCFIYGLAGLAKLLDADWMDGGAITDVFKINDFSLSLFCNTEHNWFYTLLTYSVVFYQLLFPVLVWIQPIKKWFLLMGVMQHLFIAFMLGLPSFGFIMIITYAIFYVPETFFKQEQIKS